MRSQHFLAGGRVAGNREVSRPLILVGSEATREELLRALREAEVRDEAIPKEGGSWGKHGFPHGSEAKREEMLRALHEAAEKRREVVPA